MVSKGSCRFPHIRGLELVGATSERSCALEALSASGPKLGGRKRPGTKRALAKCFAPALRL